MAITNQERVGKAMELSEGITKFLGLLLVKGRICYVGQIEENYRQKVVQARLFGIRLRRNRVSGAHLRTWVHDRRICLRRVQ